MLENVSSIDNNVFYIHWFSTYLLLYVISFLFTLCVYLYHILIKSLEFFYYISLQVLSNLGNKKNVCLQSFNLTLSSNQHNFLFKSNKVTGKIQDNLPKI